MHGILQTIKEVTPRKYSKVYGKNYSVDRTDSTNHIFRFYNRHAVYNNPQYGFEIT